MLCLALLPTALPGLGRRRWVVAAAVPLFLGLYLFNPFFLPHYAVPLAAPMAFLVAAGIHVVGGAPRSARLRRVAGASLTLGLVILCLRSLPELKSEAELPANGRPLDEAYTLPTVSLAEGLLRQEIRAPAVLLVRYRVGMSPDDEPVYNSDVAWPDDAPIVRRTTWARETRSCSATTGTGNRPGGFTCSTAATTHYTIWGRPSRPCARGAERTTRPAGAEVRAVNAVNSAVRPSDE